MCGVNARAQAAEEQELGMEPLPHIAVQSEVVVCQMEASFISAVALPLWARLAACFPALECAVMRLHINHKLFRALSLLPEPEIQAVCSGFVCLYKSSGAAQGASGAEQTLASACSIGQNTSYGLQQMIVPAMIA